MIVMTTVSPLELSKLCDDVNAHGLIEAAEAAKPLTVRAPVEAHDRLRRDDSRVEELDLARDAHRNVVLSQQKFKRMIVGGARRAGRHGEGEPTIRA